MARLRIAADGRHFTLEGRPFFWVGDTLWSAFTNPTIDEWREYLQYRRAQGFNVIQINTLPQWDRCLPDQGIYPYPMRPDGSMDVSAPPNKAYFDRARELCAMARSAGFQLALVAVWGNLVPDTWLNRIFAQMAWPLEAVEAHVRRIVEVFRDFEPVWIVSGDSEMDSPETARYFIRAAEMLKELDPEGLRTAHLKGEYFELPEALDKLLDFYVYQSGHSIDQARCLERLPRDILASHPGKPLLNAEPCYEGMPKFLSDWSKPQTEFFSEAEVIDACRRSILAGADAGITYGANGLWNWKRPEAGPGNPLVKDTPCPLWRDALRFPGAGKIAALGDLAGV